MKRKRPRTTASVGIAKTEIVYLVVISFIYYCYHLKYTQFYCI